MRYQYECDTCSENHWAEFDNPEEAREWRELWASQGMQTWEVN
jgi:hypothetical protein